MCTEKASPGATFRLGTETAALVPSSVTSCDCTASTTPRICFWLELRKERDACRSIRYAPPCGLAWDAAGSIESTATGESLGRSILRLGVCALAATAMIEIASNLLHIDHARDGHLIRIRINI